MFKNILVPHDGSDYSQRAIGMAVGIAKLTGAAISILQVLPAPFPASSIPLAGDTGAPDTTPEIEAAKKLIGNDIKVSYRIRRGDPANVVLQTVIDDGNDLVVMGSRGITGFSGLLLGSVSSKVVQLSKAPVLLAK